MTNINNNSFDKKSHAAKMGNKTKENSPKNNEINKCEHTSGQKGVKNKKLFNKRLEKIRNIFNCQENGKKAFDLLDNLEELNQNHDKNDINWDNIRQPQAANDQQEKNKAGNVLYNSSSYKGKPNSADKKNKSENSTNKVNPTNNETGNDDQSEPVQLYNSGKQYKSDDKYNDRRREIDEASGGRVIYYHQSEG